ncbi:MAG: apolipoprotein N-acyltransferase [Elusimicrobiaceae bacterium]|nr:apolipoprotein N-acyltransferase [Elusimicrobiaceae bacterium]
MSKKSKTEKEGELPLITRDENTKEKKNIFWVIVSALLKGLIISLSALAIAICLGSAFLANNKYLGAWIGIFLFAIVLNNLKKLFLNLFYCFIVGFAFNLILLYWIYPTVQFGTQDQFLSYLSLFGLSALMSLQFVLFGFFYYYIRNLTWVLPLGAASLWVSLEFLHQVIAFYLFAFPWFVLGYSQFENLALIQISSVTGVYGVSFIIVFCCFSLACLFGKYRKRQKILFLVSSIILFGLNLAFGKREIHNQLDFENTYPKQIKVALMQPNTHGLILIGRGEEAYSVLDKQALALENQGVEFIIWPETSLEGSFTAEQNQDFLKNISKTYNAQQLFGGSEIKDGKLYVSAGLFNENGLIDSYQKNKLVPFGEFLPFQKYLNNFYRDRGITSLTGNFKEGSDTGKVLELYLQDIIYPFAVNICFESLFSKIWRKQAKEGAQFFVNISNDGWFLKTAAPLQHLRINVFRAIENRRPILRATTTGYSAWIDSLGKIRFMSGKLFEQETAIFDFKFQTRNKKTIYTQYGDIFALICAFLSFSFWGVAVAFFIQENYGE